MAKALKLLLGIGMLGCLSEMHLHKHMGNKQEELEACIQLQGTDLIGITGIWWDSSQDWSAVLDGYRHRLFKKDRLRR